MKRCSKCRRELPVAEFNIRSRSPDGLQGQCRDCNKSNLRDWYAQDPARLARKKERRRATIRTLVHTEKDRPCADCGIKYPPYVMQFDHVGEDKEFNIANAIVRGMGVARIKAEIAKCEVVCANCHAVRTYQRRGDEMPA